MRVISHFLFVTIWVGSLTASQVLAGIGLQLETPGSPTGNGNDAVWGLSRPSNSQSSSAIRSGLNGLVPMPKPIHAAESFSEGPALAPESLYLAFYFEVGANGVTVTPVAVGASIAELTSLVSDKPRWASSVAQVNG